MLFCATYINSKLCKYRLNIEHLKHKVLMVMYIFPSLTFGVMGNKFRSKRKATIKNIIFIVAYILIWFRNNTCLLHKALSITQFNFQICITETSREKPLSSPSVFNLWTFYTTLRAQHIFNPVMN